MEKKLLIVALLFMVILSVHPVSAQDQQEKEKPWKKFDLNLGGYIAALDSSVNLGLKEAGIGLEIDVEKFLGLDTTQSVFMAAGHYCFPGSRRHRLDFSWTAFRRSSRKTLTEEIEIEEKTLVPGTTVKTTFNFDVLQLKYGYSFIYDDRMDLGFGFGLYGVPFKFKIDVTSGDESQEPETTDFIAPLPVITLRGNFAITPKLIFLLNWDFFYLEYDNFTGSLSSGQIGLEYYLWKYVGFGMSFDNFRVRLDVEDETDYPGLDFIGTIDFEYSGIQLYMKVYF